VLSVGSVAEGMSRKGMLGEANILHLGELHIAGRSERISIRFLRIFN